MTRQEMIAMVERLLAADGTEEELKGLRQALNAGTPYSNIHDLIYYDDDDLSSEQIVDEALRREEEHAAHVPLAQKATA